MFQPVRTATRVAALGVLLGGLAVLPAHAQLNYRAADATASQGTYTDLAATGTAIATANTDDAVSAVQNIGFPLAYDGQSYTQFTLSTNGFIKLGATPPSSTGLYYTDPQAYTGPSPFEATDTVDIDIISPFNYDLEQGVGTAEYRMATTGTAPNRVTTVQWKNVRDKTIGAFNRQLNNISFQVKIYETSGQIEFVYGAATRAAGAAGFRAAGVGLVGRGVRAGGRFLTVTKGSVQPWDAPDFQDGGYGGGNRFNFRADELPAAGQTYTFVTYTVPTVNDAAVMAVYALGTLPIPQGAPHQVQAVVANNGTTPLTNVAVTLTVNGATMFTNTQTLSSLGFGDEVTITFPGYTPPAAGMNQINVSIAASDDTTANNTGTYDQQVVTTHTYGYADSSPATNSYGLNNPGLWITRYNTTATGQAIESVGAYLGGGDGSIVYGVLVDSSGAILARTPNYTITAADIDTYHQFVFPTHPAVGPGDFYVGMAQVGTMVFPMGTQDEDPLRPNTFFIATSLTGAPLQDLADQLPVRLMLEVTLGPAPACTAPTNLVVSGITATGSTVTFGAVTGAQSYTVIYGPAGFTPGGAGSQSATVTGTTFNIPGLTSSTAYDVYVRTICSATDSSANNGPVTFSTSCVAPTISTFPYVQDFDTPAATQQLLCGISVVDVNNDGFTWTQFNRDTLAANMLVGTPHSAPNFMGYLYNAAQDADDWFFLPAIQVPAGQQLRASWWQAATYGGGQVWDERLEVKWGTAATVAAMTNTIYPNTLIDDTTYTQVFSQPITGTGTVYVGFHCVSEADKLLLRIDDVTLDFATGISNAALARAVSVFPNPSAGRLNVQVTESGAARVALRVLDNLGRVVYSGTMTDNAIKNVDLSTLSNGLYTVQVTLDDAVVTKQVNILK